MQVAPPPPALQQPLLYSSGQQQPLQHSQASPADSTASLPWKFSATHATIFAVISLLAAISTAAATFSEVAVLFGAFQTYASFAALASMALMRPILGWIVSSTINPDRKVPEWLKKSKTQGSSPNNGDKKDDKSSSSKRKNKNVQGNSDDLFDVIGDGIVLVLLIFLSTSLFAFAGEMFVEIWRFRECLNEKTIYDIHMDIQLLEGASSVSTSAKRGLSDAKIKGAEKCAEIRSSAFFDFSTPRMAKMMWLYLFSKLVLRGAQSILSFFEQSALFTSTKTVNGIAVPAVDPSSTLTLLFLKVNGVSEFSSAVLGLICTTHKYVTDRQNRAQQTASRRGDDEGDFESGGHAEEVVELGRVAVSTSNPVPIMEPVDASRQPQGFSDASQVAPAVQQVVDHHHPPHRIIPIQPVESIQPAFKTLRRFTGDAQITTDDFPSDDL